MAKKPNSSPEELVEKVAAQAAAEESEMVQSLRTQVRRLERQNAKLRTKEELINAAVEEVFRDRAPTMRVPTMPKRDRRRSKPEQVAVLHLSDWQLGKVTTSFNSQVARERALDVMRKTIKITELRRSISPVRKLRIYEGGDMIEGEDIFPHQAHEIDSPLYDQACVNGPNIMVELILMALEAFDDVWIGTVPGNHGRNGPRNTRSSPKTNWDRVMANTTKAMLLGPPGYPRTELEGRLTYHTPEDFYFVDRVFNWGNLVVHGHQVTGGFAGFPWYGVGKKAWGWIDAIEEKWDHLFFGHFHTPAFATLGHRKFYANGTLESDNEFAKEQLAACGVPAQRLCFMDAEHGIISDDILELVPRIPTFIR